MLGAGFQMQADLINFLALKQYDNDFKYILVVIDVFFKMDMSKQNHNKSF